MDMQNILMLIQAFTDHSLTELNVEDGGVKVCLKRDAMAGAGVAAQTVVPGAGAPAQTAVPGIATPAQTAVPGIGAPVQTVVPGIGAPVQTVVPGIGAPVQTAVPGIGTPVQTVVSEAGIPAAAVVPGVGAVPAAMPGTMAPASSGTAADTGAIASDKVVSSPLVGIFYSASSPEAEDFVKVGDRVKKGQVLGIVEAMKLMNEIESEFDGIVEAILVKNEDVVEYGQPLFRIR